jgi:mannose-binding lectin 2
MRGSNIPTKAKLTYFQENYLQLDLQYKNVDTWVQCFSVSNVTLPQVAYLGFTAHCGELSGKLPLLRLSSISYPCWLRLLAAPLWLPSW